MNIIKKISSLGLAMFLVMSFVLPVQNNNAMAATVSSATRTISNLTPAPGEQLTVSLALDVVAPDTYYAIDETVPTGWVISNPGTGATSQADHLKWVVTGPATSTVYQYIVTVPATATGTGAFSGQVGFGSGPGTDVVSTILGDTSVTVTPLATPVLTSVTVSPVNPTINIGSTQQFTASALDQNLAPFIGATTTWSSDNTAVATVDTAGLVTALASGTSTITATAVSGTTTVTGSSMLTVINPTVNPILTSVVISPMSPTVMATGTQQFTAIGLDQNGIALAVQPLFDWTSSDVTVGTIGLDTGLFSALSAGTTTVTVTSEGTVLVSASTVVTVSNPLVLTSITVSPVNPTINIGAGQQFTAIGLDQNGVALVSQPTFTWSGTNPTAGTIDAVTGLFTALANGTSTISATSGMVAGNTLVTVVTPAVTPVLTSVVISPISPIVNIGATQQFTATGLDQNGIALAVQPLFDWASSNVIAGTIGLDSGLFSALSSGTTTITATTEGTILLSASTTATVVGSTSSTSTLMVTQITPIQVSGTANNNYGSGWKWVFDVTVPTDETQLGMKFSDWVSGSHVIPAAGNMRYFSSQSSNANSESSSITIDAANTYPSTLMNLNGDMDASAAGRQIQITVEVKIPTGSAVGSYSTTYGIQSTVPTVVTQPLNILSVINPANINLPFETEISSTTLPSTVGVNLSNSSSTSIPVIWSATSTPIYNDEVPGTYVFTGALTLPLPTNITNTNNLQASINVIVGASSTLPGTLSAEDFGVVNYDTGLGIIKGYTSGFGLTDATFANVQSVVVRLYSNNSLLQTNTATAKVGTNITGVQISSPFDVFGNFDYATDGYWTNTREAEYGQTLVPTKVIANVTLSNGKQLTAENDLLTGDPSTIFPVVINIASVTNPADVVVPLETEVITSSLPATIEVSLSDSSTTTLPVIWSATSTPIYNDEVAGTYIFSGALTLPANISNTGNLLASVNVIVSSPVISATDIKGTYNLDFTDGTNTYSHIMNIVTEDLTNSNFSGNGSYIADSSITWNMTGNITNNDVTFQIVYTGTNPGYTLDSTGVLAGNNITGTTTGGSNLSFTATKQ